MLIRIQKFIALSISFLDSEIHCDADPDSEIHSVADPDSEIHTVADPDSEKNETFLIQIQEIKMSLVQEAKMLPIRILELQSFLFWIKETKNMADLDPDKKYGCLLNEKLSLVAGLRSRSRPFLGHLVTAPAPDEA